MKKLILLFLFIQVGIKSDAQSSCNIGFESPLFTDNFTLPSNMIFALKATLSSNGNLNAIGINTVVTGVGINVKLAVYDDNAGLPGNLIAFTGSNAVTGSSMLIPVTPVFLSPGDYHIAAIIDGAGNVISTNNSSSIMVSAMSNNFSDPFPATGAFSTLTGYEVNIWMDITCSAASVNEIQKKQFSVYPNPCTNFLYLQNNLSGETISSVEIINSMGQLVNNYPIENFDADVKLSTENLNSGIYIVRLKNRNGLPVSEVKFIKE